jgi:2-amino-4-hydroxy-6-hydroxymethyldihydropteridine diphosphokinase
MASETALYESIALALGSNTGDRQAALRAAVKGLAPFLTITAISPIYETPAAYVTDQPAFLNAVLTGTTQLAPLALLQAIKQLETALGRQPSFRYGPRLIDIDIIFYGQQVSETPELTVPHPLLAEREFVLRPLADIAPDWLHPMREQTVTEILAQLPERKAVRLGNML